MKKIALEFIRRGLVACGFGPLVLAALYLILQHQEAVQTLSVDERLGIYNIRVTQKVTLIYYFIFTLYLFDIFPYIIVYRF